MALYAKKSNKVGAIVMDLSKAFDKLNHNLLLCKLKAYGFDTNALTFLQSNFSNRHQRTKVGDKFSKQQKYQQACLKALSLSHYFSTFLLTISFFLLKLLHFATMQMTILCILQTKTLIHYQQTQTCAFAMLSEWFYKNHMVLNADKCHSLTIGFNEPFPDFSFNDTTIENVTEEKSIGIETDIS